MSALRPNGSNPGMVCEFADESTEDASTAILSMIMAVGNAKVLETLCERHAESVHTVAHGIADALEPGRGGPSQRRN